MTAYFVTRHRGAREWAVRRGIVAKIVEHLDPKNVGQGDLVIGSLPVNLAGEVCALGARYFHLSMDIPFSMRGVELSADQMESLGAALIEFKVEKLS